MIKLVISYEMFDKNFGLKAEEYGIKPAVPLRIGKNIIIEASNGFEAQAKLEKDLKQRFGADKQIFITSCISQEAHEIFQRAINNLKKGCS